VELGLGQLLLLDVLGVVQDLRVLAVLGDELDEGADKGANGAPVARQDGFVLQDRRYLEMKVWYSSLEMKVYDNSLRSKINGAKLVLDGKTGP